MFQLTENGINKLRASRKRHSLETIQALLLKQGYKVSLGSLRALLDFKHWERFWRLVDKSDASGCWPYQGAQLSGAPRRAWILSFGELDKATDVESKNNIVHTCTRGNCCRPDHMSLGTRSEANKAMVRPSLKDSDHEDVKKRVARGETIASIAKLYRTSERTIRRVIDPNHIRELELAARARRAAARALMKPVPKEVVKAKRKEVRERAVKLTKKQIRENETRERGRMSALGLEPRAMRLKSLHSDP